MEIAPVIELLDSAAFDVSDKDESGVVDHNCARCLEFPGGVALDTPFSEEFTLGAESLNPAVPFVQHVDPFAFGTHGDVAGSLELAGSAAL